MPRQDTAAFFNLAHSLRYIANLKSFLSWSKVCFVAGPNDRYVLPGKLRMVKRIKAISHVYLRSSFKYVFSIISKLNPSSFFSVSSINFNKDSCICSSEKFIHCRNCNFVSYGQKCLTDPYKS